MIFDDTHAHLYLHEYVIVHVIASCIVQSAFVMELRSIFKRDTAAEKFLHRH